MKNILILGSRLTGKTTLANKLNEEFGLSIIRLDDIVKAFDNIKDATPEMKSDFIINYINNLSSDIYFYCNKCCVIEGNIKDVNILTKLDYDNLDVISLIYNQEMKDTELLQKIKKNSDVTSWTYYLSDDVLLSYIQSYLSENADFQFVCKEYNFDQYDVSENRDEVFKKIIDKIKEDRPLVYK